MRVALSRKASIGATASVTRFGHTHCDCRMDLAHLQTLSFSRVSCVGCRHLARSDVKVLLYEEVDG